jgi:hypothetical protein
MSSFNPFLTDDLLGKIQVQKRNQQLKIYQKWLSLPRGKKRVGLCIFGIFGRNWSIFIFRSETRLNFVDSWFKRNKKTCTKWFFNWILCNNLAALRKWSWKWWKVIDFYILLRKLTEFDLKYRTPVFNQ